MTNSKSHSHIHSITDLSNIVEVVHKLDSSVISLLDVDDTLIVPKSTTFHKAPYCQMIDDLKANKESYPHFEDILSEWRQQREVMLVDQAWPNVLKQLQQKGPVYGLTKVHTGRFGGIESMAQWRCNELEKLGLSFTIPKTTKPFKEELDKPCFHKGIMMTGASSKYDTLMVFAQDIGLDLNTSSSNAPTTIVFVDDREENLREIGQFCWDHGFAYCGIYYRGLDALESYPKPEVARLQKQLLISELRWVEDQEALKILTSKTQDIK